MKLPENPPKTPYDFARKPDPDQPWRFVCKHCGGQVSKNNSPHLYRCFTCKQSTHKNELIDKKTGQMVRNTDEQPNFVHQ